VTTLLPESDPVASVEGILALAAPPSVTPELRALVVDALGASDDLFVIASDARTSGPSQHLWLGEAARLGDRVDAVALASGWHGFDYLAITGRYVRVVHQGAWSLFAYPLGPVAADIEAGRGATSGEVAEWLGRLGLTARADRVTRSEWLGVGPALRHWA
jgi:hypothetical protein